jgi:hypothetical protein
MHPDLLGALARQHYRELAPQKDLIRWKQSRPAAGGIAASAVTGRRMLLQRARWHVGSVLLDLGVHLMTAK